MKTKNSNKFVYLALFLFLSFFMSWWGGYITSYFKEPWYSTLIKPSFNPPDWMFAPVWISLYLLIGYASWLMWSSKNSTQKVLNIYFIHLIFNASWTVTFFASSAAFCDAEYCSSPPRGFTVLPVPPLPPLLVDAVSKPVLSSVSMVLPVPGTPLPVLP